MQVMASLMASDPAMTALTQYTLHQSSPGHSRQPLHYNNGNTAVFAESPLKISYFSIRPFYAIGPGLRE